MQKHFDESGAMLFSEQMRRLSDALSGLIDTSVRPEFARLTQACASARVAHAVCLCARASEMPNNAVTRTLRRKAIRRPQPPVHDALPQIAFLLNASSVQEAVGLLMSQLTSAAQDSTQLSRADAAAVLSRRVEFDRDEVRDFLPEFEGE